jgi:hypothetical protein
VFDVLPSENACISASEVCIIGLFMYVREPSHGDIAQVARQVAALGPTARYVRGIVCPLLIDGRCAIYAASGENRGSLDTQCRGRLSTPFRTFGPVY